MPAMAVSYLPHRAHHRRDLPTGLPPHIDDVDLRAMPTARIILTSLADMLRSTLLVSEEASVNAGPCPYPPDKIFAERLL